MNGEKSYIKLGINTHTHTLIKIHLQGHPRGKKKIFGTDFAPWCQKYFVSKKVRLSDVEEVEDTTELSASSWVGRAFNSKTRGDKAGYWSVCCLLNWK